MQRNVALVLIGLVASAAMNNTARAETFTIKRKGENVVLSSNVFISGRCNPPHAWQVTSGAPAEKAVTGDAVVFTAHFKSPERGPCTRGLVLKPDLILTIDREARLLVVYTTDDDAPGKVEKHEFDLTRLRR